MKGLLAPQNTFLDTIATRFDGTRKFAFNYSEITFSDESLKSCISRQSLRLPWYFMLVIRHCIVWCSWKKKKTQKKKRVTESCLFFPEMDLTKVHSFLIYPEANAKKWPHRLEDEPLSLSAVLKAPPAPRTALRRAPEPLAHKLRCLSSGCQTGENFQTGSAQTVIKTSLTYASALFNFPNEQTVSPLSSRTSELRFLRRIYTSLLQEFPLLWFYLWH